jgi:hypothetical protein
VRSRFAHPRPCWPGAVTGAGCGPSRGRWRAPGEGSESRSGVTVTAGVTAGVTVGSNREGDALDDGGGEVVGELNLRVDGYTPMNSTI